MKKGRIVNISLGILAIGFVIVGWWYNSQQKPLRVLPVYGPHHVDTLRVDGVEKLDTIYHRISSFNLVDQQGMPVNEKTFSGKIYVADFFFTTCRDICPVMSGQMQRVYEKFKENDQVLFASHTVNPAYDTVSVLAEYAKKHNAAAGRWYFLTGDKKEIYKLARESYLLSATEGNGGPDDFVHTQNFALVDKQSRIRGFYDGTDSTEVNQLMIDLTDLLLENKSDENNKADL